ncbi:MAG: hypothetical protein RL196_1377 [Actinomycetota bacterium]|jgi:uncharacterized protein (DUF779 family)
MYENLPPRVETTPAADDLLRKLTATHGPLMFHQSGGCCDGSAPMCYLAGEFRVGGQDVLLGELLVTGIDAPIKVWISLEQFEYWKHTHITIDVVPGRGGGFSLESPEGMRFIIRSRLFSDDDAMTLLTSPILLGSGDLKVV